MAYALVLVVVTMATVVTAARWTAYLSTVDAAGTPEAEAGRDYRAFSVAGSLASEGDAEAIYDANGPRYDAANAAVFVYPPWFALGMVPWSPIPFQAGYWLWLGATLGLAAWALWTFGWRLALAAIGVLALTAPGLQTIFYGQSAYLLVAGAVVVAWALARGRPIVGGVALGLMSFKPHVVLGVGVAAIVQRARGRLLLVSACVSAVALLVIGELAIRGGIHAWVSALVEESSSLVDARAEVNLAAVVTVAFGSVPPLWSRLAILALGLAWLVSVMVRRDLDPGSLLIAAFGVSVVCGLHALAYDSLLLAGPVLLAWRDRPSYRTSIAIGSALVVSAVTLNGVVLALQGGDRGLMLSPIVLAVFIVVVAESRPARSIVVDDAATSAMAK